MGRKPCIRIIGQRAEFDTERWAHAVEALARQLRREWQATGDYLQPPEVTHEAGARESC